MHPLLRVFLALRIAAVALFFIIVGIYFLHHNDPTLGMSALATGFLIGFFAWDFAYHRPSREFAKLLEEVLPPAGYVRMDRTACRALNTELTTALPNAGPGARVLSAWHKSTPAGDLYWGRAAASSDYLLTVGFAFACLPARLPFRVDLRTRGLLKPGTSGWHQQFRIIWTNQREWDHFVHPSTLQFLSEFADFHLTLHGSRAAAIFVGHEHGRPAQAALLTQAVSDWEQLAARLTRDALLLVELQPEVAENETPTSPTAT